MPFALPEYDAAFAAFLGDLVNDLARARSGMLSAMPRETHRSSVASRIRDRDGLDVDAPEQTVGFRMTLDVGVVRAGDPVAFALEVDRASDESAEELVGMVIKSMSAITDATGNVTKSRSGKFDFESIYEALEKMDWSLTDEGRLSMPSMIMNPADAKKLAESPPLTKEQQAKMDALKQRKLEELLARRRYRRLS